MSRYALKMVPKSELEETLAFHIKAAGLPVPEREYRFEPKRKWRFDFAYPDLAIGIECEGGIWTGGRHIRGAGFERDCEKYNAAAINGWMVLRFTKSMITSGNALIQIERAIEAVGLIGYE